MSELYLPFLVTNKIAHGKDNFSLSTEGYEVKSWSHHGKGMFCY